MDLKKTTEKLLKTDVENIDKGFFDLLKEIKNEAFKGKKSKIKNWEIKGVKPTTVNRSIILSSLDTFKEKVKKREYKGYTAAEQPYNEFRYVLHLPPKIRHKLCKRLSEWLGGKWELRGVFCIPPGGFLGWHTNANATSPRIYFVWNDSDTSQFYVDTKNGIKTINEKKGWRRNVFTPPAWHAGRTDGYRFSIGFRPIEEYILNEGDVNPYYAQGTHTWEKSVSGRCCKDPTCTASFNHSYNDKTYKLNLVQLEPFLKKENLKTVSIKDIDFKGRNCKTKSIPCLCCDGERIANVDLKYPIIIVKGMNNYNKKYTSLDGRHRLLKLITQKLDYVNAYILEEGDVKSVWNRKYGE